LSAIKTSVLIVDDDISIRETLRSLLEDAGYAVFEVQDGLQALDYLRKTPSPMIVLLDLMMPRLDGAGLLGTVAGDTRRLVRHRYILMTASHETLSLAFVHLLSDLTVPVLHKPFDIDKLLEIIASRKLPPA
jgi:CheY-like chemotaxis protein